MMTRTVQLIARPVDPVFTRCTAGPQLILRLETQWHISCNLDCYEERDCTLFFFVYQPPFSKALTPTLAVGATNKRGGQNGI
jgi:hypothetical protein